MPSRRHLLVATALAGLVLAACGGDSQRRGADETTPPTVATTKAPKGDDANKDGNKDDDDHGAAMTPARAITVVAKNLKFEPETIKIALHETVKVTIDNQDAKVPHNIHFMTPKSAHTETKDGVSQQSVTFKVDKAGKYKYLCDVHPTMTGQLEVS